MCPRGEVRFTDSGRLVTEFTVPKISVLDVLPLVCHEQSAKLVDLWDRHIVPWQARTDNDLNSTLMYSVSIIVNRIAWCGAINDHRIIHLWTGIVQESTRAENQLHALMLQTGDEKLKWIDDAFVP